MTEDTELLVRIVNKLNVEAEKAGDGSTVLRPFNLLMNGDEQIVRFGDMRLWGSEGDEREEFETDDPNSPGAVKEELEPIESFLRHQANDLVEIISQMRFPIASIE